MADPMIETGTSLIERAGVVGATVAGLVFVGRALGIVYKDGLAKDANILAIAERGVKAQETAAAALAELRKTNDAILAAVMHCPKIQAMDRTDHAAALSATQRMAPLR